MSQVQIKMSNETEQSAEEFNFPQGIAGFPDATRFGFIYEGRGNMVCMQSIDTPEAAFILTPWEEERLGETPELTQEQSQCLKLGEGSELIWMVVLNPFADPEWVTANLKAPLAINMSERLGVQCIRHEPGLDLRFQWMRQPDRG